MRICAQVVRVKTLVDNAVRIELDLGEDGIAYLSLIAEAQRNGESVYLEVGRDETVSRRRVERRAD
jgi:hypothetical protein